MGSYCTAIPTLTNNFCRQFLIKVTILLSESIPPTTVRTETTYSGGQLPAFIRFSHKKKKKRNTNLHKGACQIYEINMQRSMGLLPQTGRKKRSEHNCQASNFLKQKTTKKQRLGCSFPHTKSSHEHSCHQELLSGDLAQQEGYVPPPNSMPGFFHNVFTQITNFKERNFIHGRFTSVT